MQNLFVSNLFVRPPEHWEIARRGLAYLAGLAARDALPPIPPMYFDDTECEYFWRAIWDVAGSMTIYGYIKGTGSPQVIENGVVVSKGNMGLQDLKCFNHGPRSYFRAPKATILALLDYLDGVGGPEGIAGGPEAFMATDTQRWNAEGGKVSFGGEQTVQVCRILFDDENLVTEPRNFRMADLILNFKRADEVLHVA